MLRGGTFGVAAVVLCLVAVGPAAAAAPPGMPKDRAPVRIDSSYGNGHFGSWQVDEFGLPTFRYALDEATDPRARQPEIYRRTDTTDAWHSGQITEQATWMVMDAIRMAGITPTRRGFHIA